MMFIKSDEKPLLKKKFINSITKKNIIFESSASNTPAQNDHIELKRNILLIKERAMRI